MLVVVVHPVASQDVGAVCFLVTKLIKELLPAPVSPKMITLQVSSVV
jgi:hypothetical protein